MISVQYQIMVRSTGYAETMNEQFSGPYVPGLHTQKSVTLGEVLPRLDIGSRMERALSPIEQRTLQEALRMSVTIIHKAKRAHK